MASKFTEEELSRLSHQELIERLNHGGLVTNGWEAVSDAYEQLPRYLADDLEILIDPEDCTREEINEVREMVETAIRDARRFANLAEIELAKPQPYPSAEDF